MNNSSPKRWHEMCSRTLYGCVGCAPAGIKPAATETQTKVVVFGLDGATFDVIKPLVERGRLPNLARLMREGVCGTLRSTILPKSPQAWASFMTGTNPGKHGIVGFSRLEKGSYQVQYINDAMRAGESLWRILGRHGKRVGVLNVPITYPPEKVNGYLVGGMFSPGTHVEFTYPPDLYQALRQELGEYIIEAEVPKGISDEVFKERYLEELSRMVRNRGAAARYLYRHYPVDFFMVVFTATDRVSHSYWRYRDPAHPEYNAQDGARYGGAIDRIYEEVDEEIGKFLAEVGDDTTVLVMSDHGMAPLYRVVHLNAWLEQQGFLQRKRGAGQTLRRAVKRLGKVAWRLLPVMPHKLLTILPPKLRAGLLGQVSFSDIYWPGTRAFSLGYDGNIFINTQGERPQGIVAPGAGVPGAGAKGADYERTCQALIAALHDLTDPETGEKLVERVYRRAEIYCGAHLDEAPDLLVAWKDYQVRNVVSLFGDPRMVVSRYDAEAALPNRHSSAHTLDGILIARGPHLRHGATLSGAEIVDLAPTILHLFGLPVPQEMDGRVLGEMFTPDYFAALRGHHPVTVGCLASAESQGDSGSKSGSDEIGCLASAHTAEDEALVESRLKGLGYVS